MYTYNVGAMLRINIYLKELCNLDNDRDGERRPCRFYVNS
jgi:hypothetical protein